MIRSVGQFFGRHGLDPYYQEEENVPLSPSWGVVPYHSHHYCHHHHPIRVKRHIQRWATIALTSILIIIKLVPRLLRVNAVPLLMCKIYPKEALGGPHWLWPFPIKSSTILPSFSSWSSIGSPITSSHSVFTSSSCEKNIVQTDWTEVILLIFKIFPFLLLM